MVVETESLGTIASTDIEQNYVVRPESIGLKHFQMLNELHECPVIVCNPRRKANSHHNHPELSISLCRIAEKALSLVNADISSLNGHFHFFSTLRGNRSPFILVLAISQRVENIDCILYL